MSQTVRETIKKYMEAGSDFTAFDIYSSLRPQFEASNIVLTYQTVVDAVRWMFEMGEMEPFNYTRTLVTIAPYASIDPLQSFRYHPAGCSVCSGDCAGANPPVMNCPEQGERIGA